MTGCGYLEHPFHRSSSEGAFTSVRRRLSTSRRLSLEPGAPASFPLHRLSCIVWIYVFRISRFAPRVKDTRCFERGSKEELKPVSTGLLTFQGPLTVTSYGRMFAGSVLTSIPLVAVFVFCMTCPFRGLRPALFRELHNVALRIGALARFPRTTGGMSRGSARRSRIRNPTTA